MNRQRAKELSVRAALMAAGLLLFAWALVSCAASADDEPQACAPRNLVAEALANDFKELPVSLSRAPVGFTVEIWAARSGSWTVIVTDPAGIACVVASFDPAQ